MNSLIKAKSYKAAVVLAVVAVFLTISVLAALGCGGSANAALKTFTYAENADPASIDPAAADDTAGVNIDRYLFDGLVGYDSATGEVKPRVAERWDISDDAKVFTFHLRKGSKFTNGREVVAGDFVYAWTRALDPATKSSMAMSIMEPVKGAADVAKGKTKTLAGAEAMDDYTLKVTLDYPLAEFVTFLGHPVAAPVPREEVEKAGNNFADNPVGNGSFKLKQRTPNEQIVLDKNPDYYGDKAQVDQVTVKIIPNPQTEVEELKAGNIDAMKSVIPPVAESIRSDSSVKLFQGQGNGLYFAGLNLNMDPWKGNDKLRQAINWAIDRQTIADKVVAGMGTPADGIVPTSIQGHQQEAMPYKYDPDKAKALLAEAGYPGGQGLPSFTLRYKQQGPGGDVAQAIQANLAAVGIKADLEGLENGVFMNKLKAGEMATFMVSWIADYNSPDTFLYTLFNSQSPQDIVGYSNPDVDKSLDKARSAVGQKDRIKAYNDVERMILADAPVVPIFFIRDVMAYSPRVTNFAHTTLGDLALNEITVADK